jgi:hypothetical protein
MPDARIASQKASTTHLRASQQDKILTKSAQRIFFRLNLDACRSLFIFLGDLNVWTGRSKKLLSGSQPR